MHRRIAFHPPQLGLGSLAHDAPRHAGHERTVGYHHALAYHRTRRNYAPIADLRFMEDGGIHPDQNLVADPARVDHGAVSQRHAIADVQALRVPVQHHVVFYQDIVADPYRSEVRPHHRPRVRRTPLADHHVPHDIGRFTDEGRLGYLGHFVT